MNVIKRDGRIAEFNLEKIINAVKKAMSKTELGIDEGLCHKIADSVFKLENKQLTVEEIQDIVEKKLMSTSRKDVAKEFILYRNKRTEIRENSSRLMKLYEDILKIDNQDLLQENANVDGESPMGQMGKIGYESARIFSMEKLTTPKIREAIKNNYIYPHDYDFMLTGTTTCTQIPLGKMLANGFNTGHGFIRPPKSIVSAASLAAIILQANQNMQHGGQSLPCFDYDLAPYVKLTYGKHIDELDKLPLNMTDEEIINYAWKKTERDTYQAMEAFIHNMNSMNSRSAGQVPFTSINYGTDTSKEGRLIIKSILLATESGMGKHETPIFPIQIFKVKEDINYNVNDPNYDLFELACKITSKRLFPNFSFLDAPFNLKYYNPNKPETEIAYMGCRTRVLANVNGEEVVTGRGNISFTTLNLVKFALESNKDINKFYSLLDKYINIAVEQLLERFNFQCSKKARNFKFLMSQGVWMDSENLDADDTLRDVLKHGTLSMGFIGLAECLKALTGYHHGENEESLNLAYDIIRFMRTKMDAAVEEHSLNFSLLATPAEGLSGKFIRKDKELFGEIEGVTNKEYYTNSYHIPVYYKIKAIDKIRKEAPFHEMCNAGHITYIELDGNARENVEAIMHLVKVMKNENIGYGSINHPVDRCPLCGFGGIIGNECPECHAKEQDGVRFERIRRITGYLVGTLDRWNTAKQAEEKDRVKHNL